jgi:hypothetical protein
MPLSYRAKATASSTLEDFAADRAADEDPRTFWVAANTNAGQTLTLDLGAVKTVQAVQVNYADYQAGIFAELPGLRTRFRILWSADGEDWSTFASRMSSERDSPNAYVQGERPVRARYVRYEHGEAPGAHLAIADLRVFGTATGPAPAAPANVTVKRGEDQRNAIVTFDAVPNPTGGRILGYNIRWGVKRDRLHLTYQVWADDLAARGGSVEIRALNAGVDYAFAVEAFGDTGVSPLSVVLDVPGAAGTVREPDPPVTGLPQPADPGQAPRDRHRRDPHSARLYQRRPAGDRRPPALDWRRHAADAACSSLRRSQTQGRLMRALIPTTAALFLLAETQGRLPRAPKPPLLAVAAPCRAGQRPQTVDPAGL